MSGSALLDRFSALEDPRQAWKVVYLLPEILLIVLCGTMAGAEDFVEIERWANRKLDFLRRVAHWLLSSFGVVPKQGASSQPAFFSVSSSSGSRDALRCLF
jgi:hypothetical protein